MDKTDSHRKLLKKNEPWKWEKDQEQDNIQIRRMLTEKQCSGHYAKVKENLVTTNASKTRFEITLWQKQDNGDIKPIASGSRKLTDTEKDYSICELELLAAVWGLEKIRFYLYGRKVLIYRSPSFRTNIETQSKQPTI